jgi:ABC-type transport system substrate-binding protein
MPRRLWLAAAMLATGASLIGSAQLAGAAPERRGGIFKFGTTGASVEIDPQVAYISTSWWMQYATAAKLYNYRPGSKLVPEVASRFTVSQSGTRYTFFLRTAFRFSDGERVTAAHFKYAFDRLKRPELASSGAQFADNVRSVRARGNRLIVDLTRPDERLVSKLTLPFFQATSTKLPLDREVMEVRSMDDLPSAGPYAFARNEVNRITQLRRNPNWRPGPGRTAPRNLDGVDVYWNLNERAAFEQVKRGELDEGPIPAAEVDAIANRYGVNRTRFWVKPWSCVGWLQFNPSAGLFKDNAPMRQAVNWAVDRTDYAAQGGPYAATPWTHLLLPGFPGAIVKRALQPYSLRPNLEKARALAAGNYRDGNVVVWTRTKGGLVPGARAEILRRDLTLLGLNVIMRQSPFEPLHWDVLAASGWCFESPDPYEFLTAPTMPYSSDYDAKIRAANRLSGAARLRAFGKLDLQITTNLAPVAVMHTYNSRQFFSDRVDPRSLKFHIAYSGWSIPAAALK